MTPVNLLNLTPDEADTRIRSWITAQDAPAYRARQIIPRLWTNPVGSWDETTNLPRPLVAALTRDFPLPRLDRITHQQSRDGTVKFLWRLPDGLAIESVWIPDGRRTTLCISSQAGCAYGCTFCATGRMGFQRHLEPWEIAGQVRAMALDPGFGRPNNVVFMGMGEPLHNWRSVDAALTILNDPQGFGIGARHITVSTVGLIPQLEDFARRSEQFRLAVSLHAANTVTRRAIMPVERKYPLPALLDALRSFERRVTFEYTMIAGVNDREEDARDLAALARPLGALVNLLPLHPGGAPDLRPTDAGGIERFAEQARAAGAVVTIRRSRGLDIAAACGQLRVETNERENVRAQ